MTKPKRKTKTDTIVECLEILTEAVKAMNKAEREQRQAEQERTSTYRGTGHANKWEAKALSIFYGDGWDEKVDEEVAQYALHEWKRSEGRAYMFVRRSEENRKAYFERLEEKLYGKGRE